MAIAEWEINSEDKNMAGNEDEYKFYFIAKGKSKSGNLDLSFGCENINSCEKYKTSESCTQNICDVAKESAPLEAKCEESFDDAGCKVTPSCSCFWDEAKPSGEKCGFSLEVSVDCVGVSKNELTVCESGCDATSLVDALKLAKVFGSTKITIQAKNTPYVEDWSELFDASLPNIIIEGTDKENVVIKHSGSTATADRDGLRLLPSSTIKDLTIDCDFVVDAVGLVEGLWNPDPVNWRNAGKEYTYNVENIDIKSCTYGVLADHVSHDKNTWYPVEGNHYFNHNNINFTFDERGLTIDKQQKAGFVLAAGARWRVTPDPGYKPNLYLNYNNINNFIFELQQEKPIAHAEHNCFAMINNRMGDPAEHMKVNIHTSMDGFNCYVYMPDIEWFITTLWELRNDFGSEQVTNEADRSYDTIEFKNSYWNYMTRTDCRIYPGTVNVEKGSMEVFANDVDFVAEGIKYGNYLTIDGTTQDYFIIDVTPDKLILESINSIEKYTNAKYRICKGHVFALEQSPEADPSKPDIPACVFDDVSIISYNPIQELSQQSFSNSVLGPYPEYIFPTGGIHIETINKYCKANKIYTNMWGHFISSKFPTQFTTNYAGQSQPACTNGKDDDSDGKFDFPNDPDCDSPFDTSESGSASYQCSDGIDNNNDGKIDWPYDKACWGATDNDELK